MSTQLIGQGEINVESGMIGLCDKDHVPKTSGYDERELLGFINSGNAFYFDTGNDGTFGINVYLVDSVKDAVDPKYNIVFRGKVVMVSLTSGKIKCADIGEMDSNVNGLEFSVDPGNYEIAVALVESEKLKFFGYSIFIKKSLLPASNELTEIETLG